MSRRPPRRQRAIFRPMTGPQLESLVARHGTPLLVIDCSAIRHQYRALAAALPGVGLYYALKPLPHPDVVATLRDLGAGFDVATAGEIALVRALATLPPGVRVIAEPGRFIAGPAGTVVASVIGRAQREGRWWYYLDDGLYGSYSGQLFDHARYPIDALGVRGPRHPSVLAGPTCDSIDVIREDIPLPELSLGDLVVGRTMGAYTAAHATDFNFIPRARIVAVNRRTGRQRAD